MQEMSFLLSSRAPVIGAVSLSLSQSSIAALSYTCTARRAQHSPTVKNMLIVVELQGEAQEMLRLVWSVGGEVLEPRWSVGGPCLPVAGAHRVAHDLHRDWAHKLLRHFRGRVGGGASPRLRRRVTPRLFVCHRWRGLCIAQGG